VVPPRRTCFRRNFLVECPACLLMTSSLTEICASAGDGVAAFTTTYWSVLLTAEGDASCSFNDHTNNDITKTDRLSEHEIVSSADWRERTELAATY
jgi:hypothetical protein